MTLFQPTTVTLCEPVTATFADATLLMVGPSNVMVDVNEPACSPLVMARRTPAEMPPDDWHCMAESDIHIVDTISLPPTRALRLMAESV